jgi:hypothetical protein
MTLWNYTNLTAAAGGQLAKSRERQLRDSVRYSSFDDHGECEIRCSRRADSLPCRLPGAVDNRCDEEDQQ